MNEANDCRVDICPVKVKDGWQEWSRHVLIELERLNSKLDHMEKDMHRLSIEIATLKVKSGVWGMVAGGIPVLIYVALNYYGVK